MANLLRISALKFAATLVSGISIFAASNAHAEYNAFKLGEAAGAYIFAIGLLEYLGQTECSYAVKRSHSIEDAVQAIYPVFQAADQKQLQSLVSEPRFQKKIAETITGMQSAARKDGLDEKTICGFMIANVSMVYDTALHKWDYAKSNFAR